MNKPYKVIFLGYRTSEFAVNFLQELHSIGLHVALVATTKKNIVNKRSLFASLYYGLKFFTIDEALKIAAVSICEKKNPPVAMCRNLLKKNSLRYHCHRFGYRFKEYNSINNDKAVHEIQSINPDLILIHSFPEILTEKLYSIPKMGTFNFHTGALPENGGPNSIEWTVLKNDSKITTCCHLVTAEIDAGDIVLSKSVDLLNSKNWNDVKKKSQESTRLAVREFFNKVDEQAINYKPQQCSERLYNKRLTAMQKYRVRLLSRYQYNPIRKKRS